MSSTESSDDEIESVPPDYITRSINKVFPYGNPAHNVLSIIYMHLRANEDIRNVKAFNKVARRLKGKRAKKDYEYFIQMNSGSQENFQELVNIHGFELNFYTKEKGKRGNTRFLKSFTCANIKGKINIHCPHFHEEVNPVFEDLALIGNMTDYYTDDHGKSFTFLEFLSKHLDVDVDEVDNLWPFSESDRVYLSEEKNFFELFKTGFEIIHCYQDKTTVLHQSRFEKFLRLRSLTKWEPGKDFILKNDRFLQIDPGVLNIHRCSTRNCTNSSKRAEKSLRHSESCQTGTKIKYKQVNKSTESPKSFLVSQKVLDESFYLTEYVSWDIETLNQETSRITPKTEVTGFQKVITIAAHKNFGREPRSRIFTRKSDDEKGLLELVREFHNYLTVTASEYETLIRGKVQNAIDFVDRELEQIECLKNFGQKQKTTSFVTWRGNLRRAKTFLKGLLKLRVFSYNGEKFDLPIILPALLKVTDFTSKEIKAVKRGSGFPIFSMPSYVFLDAKNFSGGGSLDRFCRTFDAGVSKLTFPYERYSSIEEMQQTTDFPPYSEFKSSLTRNDPDFVKNIKNGFLFAADKFGMSFPKFVEMFELERHVTFDSTDEYEFPENLTCHDSISDWFTVPLDTYLESKLVFETEKSLGKMHNMLDYLEYYNIIDVVALSLALYRYTQSCIEAYKVSPIEFTTLPALAESIMWHSFSTRVNSPFSFCEKFAHVAKLIKSRSMGGPAICFARHVVADGDTSTFTPQVHFSKSGLQFKHLFGVDANNLYGESIRQSLPTGAGSLYTRGDDGKFKWETMTDSPGCSKGSIEWLNYMQNKEPYSVNGERVHIIRHAMNGGEVKVLSQKYKVDGCVEIDGELHVMEYLGCRYHRCPVKSCKTECILTPIAVENERKKLNRLRTLKNFFYIYECQWNRVKKNVVYRNFTSLFWHVERGISETELFDAVLNDKLFGLVKCDVTSPPAVIERYLKMNHPPVYKHQVVDETMVGPKMMDFVHETQKKLSTKSQLTLGFHGQDVLLTTDFVKYYHSRGLIISNISMVVEFEKDTPLKDYVNTATAQRVQATVDDNSSRQNIAKLIVNSGYGRTNVNSDEHKNCTFVKADKKLKKHRVVQVEPVIGESNSGYNEVISTPKSKTNCNTVHYAFFITSYAKLFMLKMIDLINDYCRDDEIRLSYTDTDSFHFVSTVPLVDLAKPEHDHVWRNEIYPKLFVTEDIKKATTDQERYQIAVRMREPGLWKYEYELNQGSGIFLSPKSYNVSKLDGQCEKRACKGIQANGRLNHSDFVEALYHGTPCIKSQTGFRNSRKEKKVETTTMWKNALNCVYTKMHVEEDLCTVTPLKVNGQYL